MFPKNALSQVRNVLHLEVLNDRNALKAIAAVVVNIAITDELEMPKKSLLDQHF
jgi:hypothetical protein